MAKKTIGHKKLILNYAGCIIFDDAGRLLLQRRSDCSKWGFLGGMIELGESVEEAAIREIKEESGLDVDITSLFGIYSKYFDLNDTPPLFCKQHQDILDDIKNGKEFVYR